MADDPQQEARELYGQATVEDLKKELGERKLATSGTKPDLVERLLAHDREQAAAAETEAAGDPPPDAPPAEDGDLCAACWPDGWPTADTNNASCQHGVWDR
jgi:hypothetical protein